VKNNRPTIIIIIIIIIIIKVQFCLKWSNKWNLLFEDKDRSKLFFLTFKTRFFLIFNEQEKVSKKYFCFWYNLQNMFVIIFFKGALSWRFTKTFRNSLTTPNQEKKIPQSTQKK
jgi:hypothetical protein